jgi:hypothetical protein
MGYVGQRWRLHGWYGIQNPRNLEEPLQVRFSYSPLEKSPSQLEFLALNRRDIGSRLKGGEIARNIKKYPYFGAGKADLFQSFDTDWLISFLGARRSFSEKFSPGNFGHACWYKLAGNQLMFHYLYSGLLLWAPRVPPPLARLQNMTTAH